MEKYEKYKDSGEKWLGEVPEEWDVKRLASYFSERKVKVSVDDYEPLSVTKKGIFPQLENVARSNDTDNRKQVLKEDFVINSRSDRRGSSGVSNYDGSVSLINIVLKPRKTLYPDFCNYLLKSEAFINEYYRNGRGIVADLWTTRYQEMKMIKVAIPKMDEQIAITHYLDSATSYLDRAISQQQNMIDLLNERKQIIIQNAVTKGLDSNVKMKDSGIDWIGEIPIYWETRRLDFCAWIRARLGWKGLKASEYTDTGYPFLSAFNIVNEQLCWEPINFINRQRYEESPDIKLKIGDILLVKDGAGIGKCARVDLLPLGESTANGSLAFITPNKDVNYKYLYYLIISDSFKQLTSILINGMGVPHLTQGEMKKVKIPLPPINEQNRIADCLDNKIGKLNKAINSVQVLIEKMQERKQIIINDVVTGKVKVS